MQKINKDKRNYYLKVHGKIAKETGLPLEVINVVRSAICGEHKTIQQVLEWSEAKIKQPHRKLDHPRDYYKQLNAALHLLTVQQMELIIDNQKYPRYEDTLKGEKK